jgi:flagellar biosynthesis protein FlhA
MPHLVFWIVGGALGWLAWLMMRSAPCRGRARRRRRLPGDAPVASTEATWDDLSPVDTLGLEVGYRLIALVDKARASGGGDLLGRIKGVRKKFAQDVGFLPPPVHIRDNLDLKPSLYRVTLRGAVVGEGEAFPGQLLAINPGGATIQLPGTKTTDPAFGLPAVWIDERHKETAQMSGFTVVDCGTVVATHLSHLMQVNAAKLLGRWRPRHWSSMSPSWLPN